MKNLLLLIVLIMSLSIKVDAQDTLRMKSGENFKVKVIEVGTTEVKYKKIDNLNGPIFTILKSDLLMIGYENGTIDNFSNIQNIVENNLLKIDDSILGKNDAQRFYNGYKTAGTIALISNYIPVIPIIPSLIFSIVTTSNSNIPKDENLNYPNDYLMKNVKYAGSYRQEAMKIKKRKIWLNFSVGAGSMIIPMILLLATNGGRLMW